MRGKYVRVAERKKRANENIIGMEENEKASHFMCVEIMGMSVVSLRTVFNCYVCVAKKMNS